MNILLYLNMETTFYSLAARGLEADLVKVEVDHYKSQPGTVIVGLGDTAVQESRERVRAAIKNSGLYYPRGRVVVNLAPADVRKSGPCFDLPIALGMISLSHGLKLDLLQESIYLGELSLDGDLRPITGVLGLAAAARNQGFKRFFVPLQNAEEAALIDGIEVYGIRTLHEAVDHLQGALDLEQVRIEDLKSYFDRATPSLIDFADIRGQAQAKRALEIAAAGGHNILLNGAPGSGKTMMARALQGILPPLSIEESLEVTQLYSLSGLLPENDFLIRERPFRVVHHTASGAAIVGGGQIPKPGEITLAHRGVLFLDEMAEFPPRVLELLRQPLEDKRITISRTQGSLTYPSQFLLCGAMNPCSCGYYQVPNAKKVCECSPGSIRRYQQKISGPLLDRIDLYCTVSPVPYRDFHGTDYLESSTDIRERVLFARQVQLDRFQGSAIRVNTEMSAKAIQEFCPLSSVVSTILDKAIDRLHLSARGYHRVLKVSRTIADLEGRGQIGESDVLEALQYRRAEA
ncbi:MAG: YifB family Mg chelatase-like AAA ATPase [bacterium]|nr:YifB family Mg chelatase-like AAA ATPase [bacterium]